MTDPQWNDLLRVLRGETLDRLPTGLIIDSPWLPGWAGMTILDYFADPAAWFEANRRVVERFPDVWFLPGFWSEFGMCTEPSAFGARCVWYEDAFPNAEPTLNDYADVARMKKPDCRTDGAAPFVLRRLIRSRDEIERLGHRIRFAVARGPLNIGSYLLGHTEFLVGVKTNPDEIHQLLRVITDYLIDWIGLQFDAIDSIDGIFLLDDLIGFLRDDDFQQFALPYLKEVFACRDASVRFLHNDAEGEVTAGHLESMGVNLFNFAFKHPMHEMRRWAGPSVALLGNIPPRDVFATGTPEQVGASVAESLAGLDDRSRVIVSCGGGTPPGVPSENIDALRTAIG